MAALFFLAAMLECVAAVDATERGTYAPCGSDAWVHWHYEFSGALAQYSTFIAFVFGGIYIVYPGIVLVPGRLARLCRMLVPLAFLRAQLVDKVKDSLDKLKAKLKPKPNPVTMPGGLTMGLIGQAWKGLTGYWDRGARRAKESREENWSQVSALLDARCSNFKALPKYKSGLRSTCILTIYYGDVD